MACDIIRCEDASTNASALINMCHARCLEPHICGVDFGCCADTGLGSVMDGEPIKTFLLGSLEDSWGDWCSGVEFLLGHYGVLGINRPLGEGLLLFLDPSHWG